jgi:chemotaxis-related protein WspB
MLFLLFQLGTDRYAIDVRQVVEVLPMLAVKQIPRAPATVRGAFDYRGSSVPLIDLSQLALGRPAQTRLSTRIMLVLYPVGGGQSRLLGLLAEHVTETMSRAANEFKDSGVSVPEARYLGPVASDRDGLVQWIQVDKLLPEQLRDLLFQSRAVA